MLLCNSGKQKQQISANCMIKRRFLQNYV